jgi:hypothetical protein
MDTQGIVKLSWQSARLSQIFIRDWGCCDDYLEFHKIYGVKYDQKSMPTFQQVYQGVAIYSGYPSILPETVFDTPFRFEVLNQGYNVRIAPVKDDSSFQHWDNNGENQKKGSGNSIGRLAKGSKGIALAKSADNNGRVWLYVEIDEEYLPKNNIIYLSDKFPTKLTGWISDRFVKIL